MYVFQLSAYSGLRCSYIYRVGQMYAYNVYAFKNVRFDIKLINYVLLDHFVYFTFHVPS